MTDITPEEMDKARRYTRSLGTLNGRTVYSEDYVDELAALATKYLKRCQELEADAAEHAAIIDLQHRRMVEASRLWQAAHGIEQDSMWPDLGELLAWLMESVERESAEKRRALAGLMEANSEPYVIRISRREFMELPLDTRRKIMERQVLDFCALKEE